MSKCAYKATSNKNKNKKKQNPLKSCVVLTILRPWMNNHVSQLINQINLIHFWVYHLICKNERNKLFSYIILANSTSAGNLWPIIESYFTQDWWSLCNQSSKLWTLWKHVFKDQLQAGEGWRCQIARKVACTRSIDWRNFLWEVRCGKLFTNRL